VPRESLLIDDANISHGLGFGLSLNLPFYISRLRNPHRLLGALTSQMLIFLLYV